MVLGLIIVAFYLIWGCNTDVVHLLKRTERSFGDSKPEPPKPECCDDPHYGPYFDNSTERNVTVYLGDTAYLHCKIKQLGNRTIDSVAWVKVGKGYHVLTLGKITYTNDHRFTPINIENSNDWALRIKFAGRKDAGVYRCQVMTDSKMILSIRLNVVVHKAQIPEGPNLYIQSGSAINLTCIIPESKSPAAYLFWFHDDHKISDSSEDGIRITPKNNPAPVSRLQIQNAKPTDSGNYSCRTSYADPANITVHVNEPKAHISEGPNLYIQSGSTMNLTCIITESTSPPVYLFWFHDDRIIYDSYQDGIRVTTENDTTPVSRLQIQNTRPTDSGNYSCQTSYADPANITVHVLNVPNAHIPEGPHLYTEIGSTINLTCIITESSSPPVYLFWFHEDRIIYDSYEDGIKVTTENDTTPISRLQIQNARPTDSGNYSCQTSYADPANITVHVINGEKHGETEHDRSINVANSPNPIQILLAALLCTIIHTTTSVIRR